MPYPLPVSEGIEIYKDIYDSFCIIGCSIGSIEQLSVYDTLDDNGMYRHIRWLWSTYDEYTHLLTGIKPVPCRIETNIPMPDINGSVWKNPLESGECSLFCPPPSSDEDIELASNNYSFIIKQFYSPTFPINGDWLKEFPSTNPLLLLGTESVLSIYPGDQYSASSYPDIYPDHMEINCYKG
jgi:hypothetical protein